MVYPAIEPALARARAERMAWLLQLRWMALGGVLVAVVLAYPLGLHGINVPVLLAAILGGALYNAWFERALRMAPERMGDPLHHALADFGALTVVLWASGGVHNPFLSLAFVHVLLVSVLGDKRAFLLACSGVLASAAFLLSAEAWPPLRISTLDPEPPIAVLLGVSAFVITVVASAYVASRAQAELALRRKEAAAARRARERNAEILHSALDRLDVGLEILDANGQPTYRNRHLLERQDTSLACHRGAHRCETQGERCPVDEAREGRSGSCRFSLVDRGGRERVIEMLCFPLADERPGSSVLRLHIDRTESFLAERRLLFAERLASLGRTVQAVAHELNTPLATIQTLAADMRTALQTAPPEAEALVRDLDESATLILEEMKRCRNITQGLLAGRDQLAHSSRHGPAVLGAAVERAATLVLGTSRSHARLHVDPALRNRSAAIDPDSLVQVFVNLIQNAADVIEGDPKGRIQVQLVDAAPGRIAIAIDDNGPGLAPGTKDRVFEAFFTTKPPGKGTGLGLYTARSLLQEAGGHLELGAAPTGGVRARIDLPAAGETHA